MALRIASPWRVFSPCPFGNEQQLAANRAVGDQGFLLLGWVDIGFAHHLGALG